MADELNLHSLKPAQPRKQPQAHRSRLGFGKGRYSGRGIKARRPARARTRWHPGSRAARMPIDMAPWYSAATSADAMPIGPFDVRQPVNLRDLEARFEAGEEGVTPGRR